ncbi:hypothetical protein BO83DRAFT_4555 [Aspergillus eucalypticola CBS 122712]|uniref:Uncharacterized protein n=1 Tax=Aspergillus eucalypticola (strain CBS 122712 / IBT 29274) TaxID=1448314 RepID=A0A317WG90_ASPEC|nr:uncharacterized protein BO83DRAFT_4555 [Aspergillus eucalypticola CBS 122712]PWY85309.1 hypothetical protein BO83DRAFT_4555 [Aspergillus eucalypticola CBS 122712]
MRGVVEVAHPCLPVSLLEWCLTYWGRTLSATTLLTGQNIRAGSDVRMLGWSVFLFSSGGKYCVLGAVDGWNGDPGLVFIADLQ